MGYSIKLASLAFIAFLALPVFGSVVTSTTCIATSTSGTFSQTSADACSSSAGPIQAPTSVTAYASASISNTSSLNAGYTSSFTFGVNADVTSVTSASASLSGSNTVQFTSTGPVRPGYLSISESYSIGGLSVGATYALNIGSYAQSCAESTFSVPSECTTGSFILNQTVLVPFTLGEAFTFDQTVSSSAAVGGSIPHYANGNATVQIALFEGDPTNLTPVPLAVADAPEPGSLALLSGGLFALTVIFKRRGAFSRPGN